MEANTATQIADACGIFMVFNDTIKLYQVCFGEAWVYLTPQELEAASELGFTNFLATITQTQAESVARYGRTIH